MTTDQPDQSPSEPVEPGAPTQPDALAVSHAADVPAESVASEHPVQVATDGVDPEAVAGQPRAVEDLADLPDQEAADIASHAVEGKVRRAPRMAPFFFVGAVVGIILGVVLGLWLSDPGMDKRGVYISVAVIFVTTIVELIAGGIVVYLDKRSTAANQK